MADWTFLYVVITATIEIYADFMLRFYTQTSKLTYLVQGSLGYVGVVYFLIQSLRFGNVLYVNALWDGLSGLIESVAAYVFLGDRLTSQHQYVGLFFVIAGIVLLKMK